MSTTICHAIVAVICSSVPARADLVYGRVYCDNFNPGDTFAVKDSPDHEVTNVKTDQYKGYSVSLPPGTYTVEFKDAKGRLWQAQFHSYPQPVRQDIFLK